jgi:hypothetical protein|nr:MAG TPA: hypothetical protein [Caudoviricetes sp.]
MEWGHNTRNMNVHHNHKLIFDNFIMLALALSCYNNSILVKKGALFMFQKILPMFERTIQDVDRKQAEIKLRSDAISKEVQAWGKRKTTPNLIGQSRKTPKI